MACLITLAQSRECSELVRRYLVRQLLQESLHSARAAQRAKLGDLGDGEKVDSNTEGSESAGAPNAMEVGL